VNFIFDVGNVLIDFKPLVFLEELFRDKTLEEAMHRIVFKSLEWVKLDQGLLTHREATDIFCAREPNLQQEIRKTMQNLKGMLTLMPATVELLSQIKEMGHDLYYLSNYHKELRDHVVSKYSFWGLFDGGVFSCDIHEIKPSPEIYRHLLCKYQLSSKDCLFFDDMEENIAAAQAEGIRGVLFTDAECIRPFLCSIK